MYAAAEFGTPHFQRIRGNHISRSVPVAVLLSIELWLRLTGFRFIDWGLQNQYDEQGDQIVPRPMGSEEDEERFAAWREGRTGFP